MDNINSNDYIITHHTLEAYASQFPDAESATVLLRFAVKVIEALLDGVPHPTLEELEDEFFG